MKIKKTAITPTQHPTVETSSVFGLSVLSLLSAIIQGSEYGNVKICNAMMKASFCFFLSSWSIDFAPSFWTGSCTKILYRKY